MCHAHALKRCIRVDAQHTSMQADTASSKSLQVLSRTRSESAYLYCHATSYREIEGGAGISIV